MNDQLEFEAEVTAIVRSRGVITLLCESEGKMHKVLTNPVLTMLRVRVGHRVSVKGFEQITVIKKEEDEESKSIDDAEVNAIENQFVIATLIRNVTDPSLNNVVLPVH